MKLRFLQTRSTEREIYHATREYDVPDEEAARFIQEGAATKAAPEPSAKADATNDQPPRRTKQ
jgi:hypothetical protein